MANTDTNKADRHKLINPNFGAIVKQNSLLPGGPDTNTPITSIQSKGVEVKSQSVYLDHEQNDSVYPQLGSRVLDPDKVNRSPVMQPNVAGQRLNAGFFNLQQQPDINGNSPVADMMEGGRLAMRADPALPKSPMGLAGMPAVPGGMPGNMPGTSGPPLMPGNPGMVPGSTPQKIGKKKKGGKA